MAGKNIKGILEKLMGGKFKFILVAVGLLGIIIIFLSDIIGSPSTSKQQTANQNTDMSNYEKSLEHRLEGILAKMDGVGRVTVMVTVESGVQNIYEQDNKTTTDKTQQSGNESSQSQESNNDEDNAVLIDSGSGGQQALVRTQLQPTVKGVVVVCDGGSNPDVKLNVTEAVSKALSLPTNDISVNKMQT